jgi:hypothetical protein
MAAPVRCSTVQPVQRRRPLLADRLALAGGERGQEVVEAGIALIVPVELAVDPDQPARALEERHFLLGDEGGVGAGEAIGGDHPLGCGDEGGRKRRIAAEQSSAGNRRERDRDLELGV